jgi:molybdopterin synthase catalytic subunit
VDCTRCGIFQIDDFAEGILRDHPKTLEQIANISGFIRENSGMVINQDLTDSLFELPTPSLEQKTLRLFLRIAKEFPRPGTSFSINYWGAEMVLGKILDNKEETFDEKFIAMFQDILPWLSYGWIVNGQELAYVVQRTLQDNYGFLEKGLASGDLCITPAGWSFLDRLKKSATPNSSAQDPKEGSVKGDEMNSDDKEKQTAGSMVFHIGSVQGNVGNVSNSQVNFNDYRSVHKLLMDHNIAKQDRRELEDIMDELKTAPPEKKSSWVERGEKWFVSHKEALGACAEIIRKALGLGTEPPTK